MLSVICCPLKVNVIVSDGLAVAISEPLLSTSLKTFMSLGSAVPSTHKVMLSIEVSLHMPVNVRSRRSLSFPERISIAEPCCVNLADAKLLEIMQSE